MMRFFGSLSLRMLAIPTLTLAACGHIHTIVLTKEPLSIRKPVAEIETLVQEPARSYVRLAELSIIDTRYSPEEMKRKILEKASALGADAVIFSEPEQRLQPRMAFGQTGSVAIPYQALVSSLKGTAIRYAEATAP